jgi:hypothetical protein
MMRVAPDEYLQLPLRAHELLRDVPLYDVSVIDLPGGGEERTLADIRALDKAAAPSRVSRILYGARRMIGRVFGWDRDMKLEESYLPRLTERDRRESIVAPGTRNGAFVILYEFARESVAETRNATVHGFICTALQPTSAGYRFYLAVYVQPVSWITRPYLIAIEPFRRILYPAMLNRIRNAWTQSEPRTKSGAPP